MKRIYDTTMMFVAMVVGYALLSVGAALPFVGHITVNGQDYSLWGGMCFILVGAMVFRAGAQPVFEWIALGHKKARLGRAG